MATPIPSTTMAEEIPNAQQTNDDADVTLALLAARTADAKKGTDLTDLKDVEVGEVLAIAGYFVVCSASNPRLVRSIADDIERAVKQELGRPPMRQEGRAEQQWILIDYGDVIVHVFHEEQREFYEIERLYLDVPRIDWAV
jgi:ribosome-associated protein